MATVYTYTNYTNFSGFDLFVQQVERSFNIDLVAVSSGARVQIVSADLGSDIGGTELTHPNGVSTITVNSRIYGRTDELYISASVILHEFGHTIFGSAHTDDITSMLYTYVKGRNEPGAVDVAKGRLLYGERPFLEIPVSLDPSIADLKEKRRDRNLLVAKRNKNAEMISMFRTQRTNSVARSRKNELTNRINNRLELASDFGEDITKLNPKIATLSTKVRGVLADYNPGVFS